MGGVMASGALSDPSQLDQGLPVISPSGQSSAPQAAPPGSLLPLLSQGLNSTAWLDLVLPPFDAQCFMTGDGVTGLLNTALAAQIVPDNLLQVVENFDTIVNNYYNGNCTTEQLMAVAPAVIDNIESGETLGTQTLMSAVGTTRSGESVSVSNILYPCLTSSYMYFAEFLKV